MATTDEELNQFEKDIRQLKIEYEQFFGGGRSRPPAEIEWRIDQVIKRHGDRTAEMNFAQRFRFQNLLQTYAKYREIFRKRLKQKEEGAVPRHFGAAAKAIEEERAKSRSSRKEPAHVQLVSVACSDANRNSEKVEQLYKAFLEAKKSAGEKTDRLTLANFEKFLRQKTEQFRQGQGYREVVYVVALEGGRARLKARVKK